MAWFAGAIQQDLCSTKSWIPSKKDLQSLDIEREVAHAPWRAALTVAPWLEAVPELALQDRNRRELPPPAGETDRIAFICMDFGIAYTRKAAPRYESV